MKVLITGGTGLLGKALIETSAEDELLATYVGEYDLSNTGGRLRFVKLDVLDVDGYSRLFQDFVPDVVIHTASIGSPDYAEKNRALTWEINVGGTRNIIRLCEKHRSKFIFISSNGIYDGDHAPYAEDSPALPINYYGEVKLEGESLTKAADTTTAIIRPILMYGWNNVFERSNIVTMAIDKLRKGEALSVYDDVFSNPLFSLSCAEAIWKVIRLGRFETFNISGAERVSIYQLITKAAELFGLDQNMVRPVRQGFFNELVKRPVDTTFNSGKMVDVLGVRPLSLEEGFRIMKRMAT